MNGQKVSTKLLENTHKYETEHGEISRHIPDRELEVWIYILRLWTMSNFNHNENSLDLEKPLRVRQEFTYLKSKSLAWLDNEKKYMYLV